MSGAQASLEATEVVRSYLWGCSLALLQLVYCVYGLKLPLHFFLLATSERDLLAALRMHGLVEQGADFEHVVLPLISLRLQLGLLGNAGCSLLL